MGSIETIIELASHFLLLLLSTENTYFRSLAAKRFWNYAIAIVAQSVNTGQALESKH